MSTTESSSILIDVESRYFLIVLGSNKVVELQVDEKDLVHNADEEMDCPVDVVLHKNGYTFQDFNEWDAREIQFFRRKKGEEVLLRSISLDVNL